MVDYRYNIDNPAENDLRQFIQTIQKHGEHHSYQIENQDRRWNVDKPSITIDPKSQHD